MRTFVRDNRGSVVVECDAGGVKLDGSRLSGDYAVAENGVIVTVDEVLVPERGVISKKKKKLI